MATAVWLVGCRTPTQVTVELSTDLACPDPGGGAALAELNGATVTVGAPGQIEGKATTGSTEACDPAGDDLHRIGSIVVVPSDEDDAELGVKVVAGIGESSAESCIESNRYAGCIVARRALRFVPHEPLYLPIVLRYECIDRPCSPTTTCVRGECVSALVEDPSICVTPGACSEDSLGGGDGGAGGGDGGGYTLPQAECGRPSALTDDFEDPATAPLWTASTPPGTSAVEAGGHLVLTPASSSAGPLEVQYRSRPAVHLDEDLIRVQVPVSLNTATEAYAFLAAELDAQRRIVIEQRGDNLLLGLSTGGGSPSATSITYDPAQHRWWQIREAQGELHWETSPDGKAWATRRTVPTPDFVSTLHVVLGAGTSASIADPGAVHFDHFNRVRPPAAWCPAASFSDDFEDGVFDIRWSASTTAGACVGNEQGGAAHFLMHGDTCECAFRTSTAFDLTGSSVTIEVPPITNFHPPMSVFLAAEDDRGNRLELGFKGSNMFEAGASSASGGSLFMGASSYVQDEVFWRIREAGGTVTFEASADGTTWASKGAVDPPFPVTGMRVSFGVAVSALMAAPVQIDVPSYNRTP